MSRRVVFSNMAVTSHATSSPLKWTANGPFPSAHRSTTSWRLASRRRTSSQSRSQSGATSCSVTSALAAARSGCMRTTSTTAVDRCSRTECRQSQSSTLNSATVRTVSTTSHSEEFTRLPVNIAVKNRYRISHGGDVISGNFLIYATTDMWVIFARSCFWCQLYYV